MDGGLFWPPRRLLNPDNQQHVRHYLQLKILKVNILGTGVGWC